MQLVELELQNFIGHRYFSRKFSGGVTGVVGPNGSGKSTIFTAARWLLTGELAVAGHKEAAIYDRAGKRERSFVRGVWRQGDRTFEVARFLRPAKPTAWLRQGNDYVEGDIKVTEALEALLGGKSEVLADVLFVQQGKLLTFLEKAPAKRKDYFQELFAIDKARDIHEECVCRRRVFMLAGAGDTALTDYMRQRDVAAGEVTQFEAELAKLPASAVLHETIRSCESLLASFVVLDSAAAALASIPAREADFQAAVQRRDGLSAQHAAYQKEFDELSPKAASARAAIANEAAVKQLRSARDDASNQLEKRKQELATMFAAVPPADYPGAAGIGQCQVRIADADRRRHRARDLEEAFSRGEECPTCHASLTDRRAEYDEAIHRIPGLENQLRCDRESLHIWLNWTSFMAMRAEQSPRYQAEISRLQTYIASLTGADDATDIGDAHKVLAEESRLRGVLASLATQATVAAQAAGSIEVRLNAAKGLAAAVSEHQAKVAGHTREQVRQGQDEANRALQTGLAIWGRLSDRKASLMAIEQQIVRARAEAVKQERVKAWSQRLEDLLTTLHRDAAPHRLVYEKLRRLETWINRFAAGFSCGRFTVDDNLNFVAEFPDGRSRPATLLSGGQRAMLALPFWLSLSIVAASGAGTIYLDEPTYGLDKQSVAAFEEVLGALRRHINSQGFQCFIITHEDSLLRLFDDAVVLE